MILKRAARHKQHQAAVAMGTAEVGNQERQGPMNNRRKKSSQGNKTVAITLRVLLTIGLVSASWTFVVPLSLSFSNQFNAVSDSFSNPVLRKTTGDSQEQRPLPVLLEAPTDGISEKSKRLILLRFLYRSTTIRFQKALSQYGEELRYLMRQAGAEKFLLPHALSDESSTSIKVDTNFRERLHIMAPWLKGDHLNDPSWPISVLPAPIVGRAIVICGGDGQLSVLKTQIYSIRLLHGSDITIRIGFRDDKDLSKKSQQELVDHIRQPNSADSENLFFIDISQYVDVDLADLKGWNLKAFTMLLAPETEVALMDADSSLVQRPERLFEQKGYVREGALFWLDRMMEETVWNPREFLSVIQPNGLSPQGQRAISPSTYRGRPVYSEHIQEAGVILIDKTRRGLGLWTACLLFGRPDIRRFAQRDHHYGDKEMYWSAFETISEPYSFSPFYAGVVGSIQTDFSTDGIRWFVYHQFVDSNKEKALCGRMLHLDDTGKPLWWNGGYQTKEDDWPSSIPEAEEPLQPVLFVDGGDSRTESFFLKQRYVLGGQKDIQAAGNNQNWRLHSGMGTMCLFPNSRGFQKVPEDVRQNGEIMVKHFYDL